MNIVDRGIVFQGEENTDTQSAAYPGICVLPDGRWLCSIRVAPAKKDVWPETTFLTYSDDNGATWSKTVQPWPDREVEGKIGSIRTAYLTALGGARIVAALLWTDHSDPDVPFFNEETEGLLDTRILLSFSDDSGATWSEPELVDTAPITVATPLTGPILILQNGDWGCQIELNKHYYDLEPWRHLSVMLFSSDEGKTWRSSSCTSNHPGNKVFYWDQRPNVLADGSVLDVFWTYDRITDKYLNIQANRSTDNGRTWSPMWDTGLPGQPAQPISLDEKRTALVYVDRTTTPIIKVRVSDDGGKTWPDSTETILYSSEGQTQTWKKTSMKDAWAEMGAFSVGLPATARLSDGSVLAVYYAGPKTDYTAIEWVRIK